ncbi:DUF2169 family type VI secretion system accessory protein [Paracidovorax cattleyae]|uniref:DUF2169 family type VI secretion system accessory protein n=1 Tax=Paracidovorax cattleyae TaxID=80868 RepID=UPI0018AF6D88|nr:DUF2169 domain-containing protein [Paracidovorax cattleyae]MBF9263994.1 DUF2169 domain-containing protein [Paracidovorax cattleyae]
MSCEILNHTPFRAQTFVHRDARTGPALVVAVKGSWLLSHTEGAPARLAPAERQAPMYRSGLQQTLGSLPLEDAQAAAIQDRASECWSRIESEHVPPKPCFDLLLHAWAVAPGGQPVRAMDAAVDILAGTVARRLLALRAFAPRTWTADFGGLGRLRADCTHTASHIPLLRPFAFGGQCTDPATGRHHAIEANPEGMGYYRTAADARGSPLPWVELADRPMQDWDDRPEPAALGPVPPHHVPRRDLQGTFDEHWRATRAPELPDDFDPRHYNAAPEALQLRELPHPGHRLALHGMDAAGPLFFTWPEITLTAQAETTGGTLLPPQEMRWDTLMADTGDRLASLLWRTAIPLPAREDIGLVHIAAHARSPSAVPFHAARPSAQPA